MSEKSTQAAETFRCGFNCSQAVLSVFAEDFGLTKDSCLRLASPFGSGIARMQETCGAITGALMAIGLKYGKGADGTEADKAHAYQLAQQLIARFKEQNKSICCRELLDGLDINTPEDMAEIQKRQLFQNNCSKYVQEAVLITEAILSQRSE
ncbi:MAG TPA: C-GCAxxG-C-C family protein [Paludibacter sp.]|nr:C-GCAxxG-C-C family protein [Paludibacter sp.]